MDDEVFDDEWEDEDDEFDDDGGDDWDALPPETSPTFTVTTSGKFDVGTAFSLVKPASVYTDAQLNNLAAEIMEAKAKPSLQLPGLTVNTVDKKKKEKEEDDPSKKFTEVNIQNWKDALYFPDRKYAWSDVVANNNAGLGNDEYETNDSEPAQLSSGNLITSECGTGLHAPVIDFDIPIEVYPSSNLDHHHLYINKEIPWDKYKKLLEAFADADLVEPGYVKASIERGYSALRPAGIVKQDAPKGINVLKENALLRQSVYTLIREKNSLSAKLAEKVDPQLLEERNLLAEERETLLVAHQELSEKVEKLTVELNQAKLAAGTNGNTTWA